MFQRKSDGLWVERFTVDGKRIQLTAKTRAELKKKIAAYDSAKKKTQNFDQVASDWEEAKASNLAYNTYQSYKPHIARAVDAFGDTPVTEVTPAEVQAYIDKLASQGYARDTVHRALVVCSMIFDHAILMPGSQLRFNPCSAVRVPRGLKKTRREPPSEEQLSKITPDTEMGLFAYFLLYTGLRRGELLALRWEDIDRENRLIHVNKAVYFESNNPHLKSTKTESSVRDVELLDVLADVLPQTKNGYVFGGDSPWTASMFYKRWLSWCRSIGCAESTETSHTAANGHRYTAKHWKPTISPHQFRHWYASLLEAAGVTEFGAKSALGHSSITVTKDVYTHIRNQKQDRIGEKLNAFVESTAE